MRCVARSHEKSTWVCDTSDRLSMLSDRENSRDALIAETLVTTGSKVSPAVRLVHHLRKPARDEGSYGPAVGVGEGVGDINPFATCSPACFAPVSSSELGVLSF